MYSLERSRFIYTTSDQKRDERSRNSERMVATTTTPASPTTDIYKSHSTVGIKRYPQWLRTALLAVEHSNMVWIKLQNHQQKQEKQEKHDKHEKREKRKNNNAQSTTGSTTTSLVKPSSDSTKTESERSTPVYNSDWSAIQANDVNGVSHFLAKSGRKAFFHDDRTANGLTVLHDACYHGSVDVVKQLFSYLQASFGTDTCRALVNEIDTYGSGMTPLIATCRGAQGFAMDRVEILQLLIKYGADVEHQDAHGDNVIHWCARYSRLLLLRWLLKETDAAARAICYENYKLEKPLDIAKRQQKRHVCMESKGVYQLLRNFDRDCNIRLKIQVIKKATTTLENDSFQKEQEEITNVVENVTSCVTRVDLFMKEMFLGAEKNRQSKENAFVNTSIEAVLHRAKEWLDSKDGKNYIKRQIPIETEVFKMELQRTKATTTTSSIMKPKGMKKLILDRIEEKYCTQQQEEARHAAIKTFRIQNPIYDPLHVTQKEWSKLKQNLTQVKTID